MPNLYGNSHDQFLENYLNKNEFVFFKEERHLFVTRKQITLIILLPLDITLTLPLQL